MKRKERSLCSMLLPNAPFFNASFTPRRNSLSFKVTVLVMQHRVVFVKNATRELETAYTKTVVFQSHFEERADLRPY